ncbi:MAG: DUF1223 domain-containing protein [Cellvibrionaceae bacterium]
MSCRIVLLGVLLFASLGHAKGSKPITVVELFTSQGCYSCPPADAFLGELKHQDNIIALSCHVTYWNYLGWRDTFSKRFCDNRQRGYQSYLQGNAGVYTPQMIVNGQYAGIGSRKSRIHKLINVAQQRTQVQSIQLSFSESEKRVEISLPELVSKTQRLLLLGTSGEHSLPIARGENGGKQLTYHNPVEEVIQLGAWDGQQKKLVQEVDSSSVNEWVVIAQEWPLGQITAAGKVSVK